VTSSHGALGRRTAREEDVRSMSRGREEELTRRETCLVLHTSA
jgi:hypothetical protein